MYICVDKILIDTGMDKNNGAGYLIYGVATAFVGGMLSLWVFQKLFAKKEKVELHEYKEKENESEKDSASVVDEDKMQQLEDGLEKAVEEIENNDSDTADSDWKYEEYDFGENEVEPSGEKKQAVKREKQTETETESETLNSDGCRNKKRKSFGSHLY